MNNALYSIAAAFVGALFIFQPAYGQEVIFQQTEKNTNLLSTTGAIFWTPLATSTNPTGFGMTGVPTQVTLWLKQNTSPVGEWFLSITQYDDVALSQGQLEIFGAFASSTTSSLGLQTNFYDSTVLQFQPSKFYRLALSCTGCGNRTTEIFGTSTPDRMYFPANAVGSPYIVITGIDSENPLDYTTSYVSAFTSPSDNQIFPSRTVSLSFAYYNTGYEGFDKAGYFLNNLTANQSIVVSEKNILTTGSGSHPLSIYLNATSTYSIRPYLRNSDTGQYVYGNLRVFHVLSNAGGQSLLPNVNDPNATSTVQGIFSGVYGILGLFVGKFPFNWFYEVANIFSTLDDSESTSLGLSLDFAGVSTTTDQLLGGAPLMLFSSSTIQTYMFDGMLTLIRGLIAAALYMGLATNIFFTIRNLTA